jgi:hypothetical protein
VLLDVSKRGNMVANSLGRHDLNVKTTAKENGSLFQKFPSCLFWFLIITNCILKSYFTRNGPSYSKDLCSYKH